MQQLEFAVNSSHLSDRQCYNQSYNFNSPTACDDFANCSDLHVISTLKKSNPEDYVSILEDRSSLEIVVEVPEMCSCSTSTSTSTSSSAGFSDAAIAAVILAVLVAVAMSVTATVVAVLCFKSSRKKAR